MNLAFCSNECSNERKKCQKQRHKKKNFNNIEQKAAEKKTKQMANFYSNSKPKGNRGNKVQINANHSYPRS